MEKSTRDNPEHGIHCMDDEQQNTGLGHKSFRHIRLGSLLFLRQLFTIPAP